jgi:hypothetical protein
MANLALCQPFPDNSCDELRLVVRTNRTKRSVLCFDATRRRRLICWKVSSTSMQSCCVIFSTSRVDWLESRSGPPGGRIVQSFAPLVFEKLAARGDLTRGESRISWIFRAAHDAYMAADRTPAPPPNAPGTPELEAARSAQPRRVNHLAGFFHSSSHRHAG